MRRDERKDKNERKKGFGLSVKLQLAIGFIVPILFLVFIGMFSYEKRKQA